MLLVTVVVLAVKSLIERERPDNIVVSLNVLFNFAFPSMHAAGAFVLLPLLAGVFRRLRISFLVAASAIAFSRIYLAYHFVSDVAAGAIIGYFAGAVLLKFKDEAFFVSPEMFARQFLHIVMGLLLAGMIYFGYFSNIFFLALIVLGLAVSYVSKKQRIPVIAWFLDRLERKEEMKTMPGKGTIYFLLGALVVNLFFEKDIAAGAIIILAVADPVSHIIGNYYGKIKSPFSKKRFLEGTLLGIVAGFIWAVFFVSPVEAFFGSLAAMILEAVEIRIGKEAVDDNLVVPVVAAVFMALVRVVL